MSLDKYYPLVSIVIPAYNGAKYLESSVQSVLEQDYPNIELLVFDDGSTDNTVDILKCYGNSFYWESHENIGQSATLNKGWKMAKGEILSYLSVDDLLEPNAVSVSIKYLLAHPDIMMTYGDYALIDEKGQFIKAVHAPEYNYQELVSKLIVQPGPGVFFRQKAFQKIGGWDVKLSQMPDYEYWLRLGRLGDFKRIPEQLAKYRVHDESQSFSNISIYKSEEAIRVMTKYFSDKELPECLHDFERLSISYAYLMGARFHIRSGRYRRGLNHFVSAVRLNKRVLCSYRTTKLLLSSIKYRLQYYGIALKRRMWGIVSR